MLLVALAILSGCGPVRAPAPVLATPILSPAEVLEAHNAWADSIRHVWSRAELRLNFPTGDPSSSRLTYDLDGHVFMAKPDRLYVHGAVLGQEVFKIGMNPERFWLWVGPKVNSVWTGQRGGPGERRFIVSPADLMTALGLFRIELDPAVPGVFVAQDRHYVLSQDHVIAGEVLPRRRIWFDRATLRPARVDLYDDSGRCVLMAELLRYERAGDIDLCTVYRVHFYGDEEVAMVLQLSSVRLDKEPNPKVFEFAVPPEAKVNDLDKPE